jgi:hypothetical protein
MPLLRGTPDCSGFFALMQRGIGASWYDDLLRSMKSVAGSRVARDNAHAIAWKGVKMLTSVKKHLDDSQKYFQSVSFLRVIDPGPVERDDRAERTNTSSESL